MEPINEAESYEYYSESSSKTEDKKSYKSQESSDEEKGQPIVMGEAADKNEREQ